MAKRTKSKGEPEFFRKRDGGFEINFAARPRGRWYAQFAVYRQKPDGVTHEIIIGDCLPDGSRTVNTLTLVLIGQWWEQFKQINQGLWLKIEEEGRIAEDANQVDFESIFDPEKHRGIHYIAGTHLSYFGEYGEMQTFMFSPSALHRLTQGEDVGQDVATFSELTVLLPTSALHLLLQEIFGGES